MKLATAAVVGHGNIGNGKDALGHKEAVSSKVRSRDDVHSPTGEFP